MSTARLARATTDVLARLDHDGFAVVADALDSATVMRLRESAAYELIDATGGTRHASITQPLQIADHPLVEEAARFVIDDDFECVASSLRDPTPGYGQQGLHTDWPARTSHDEPFVGISCLWLLDDFTPTNGATRVVPGTHRQARAIPKRYVAPNARHEDEILLQAAAGALIVFNCHLWHSGTMNRSNEPRRVLQEQYIAAPLAPMYAAPRFGD